MPPGRGDGEHFRTPTPGKVTERVVGEFIGDIVVAKV